MNDVPDLERLIFYYNKELCDALEKGKQSRLDYINDLCNQRKEEGLWEKLEDDQ